jgi:hypothetical protein
MKTYFLRNLSELAQKRAILMREEAQLWDILSRDLKREAGRIDEKQAEGRPTRPSASATLPQEVGPPEAKSEKLLVPIAEAARMMGIGRSSLYKEIGASRLKVRKAGKRTLVAVADIHDWWSRLPEGNP